MEILPHDSADLWYTSLQSDMHLGYNEVPSHKKLRDTDIPCWTAEALLDTIKEEETRIERKKWMGTDKYVYRITCRDYDTNPHTSLLMAAYIMVLKLWRVSLD